MKQLKGKNVLIKVSQKNVNPMRRRKRIKKKMKMEIKKTKMPRKKKKKMEIKKTKTPHKKTKSRNNSVSQIGNTVISFTADLHRKKLK